VITVPKRYVTDGRTDKQTDRRTKRQVLKTCCCMTAMCVASCVKNWSVLTDLWQKFDSLLSSSSSSSSSLTRYTSRNMVQAERSGTRYKVWMCDMCCEYTRLLVFRTNISKVSSNQLQQSMPAWEYCLTTVRKPSVTSRCVSAAWLLLLLWQPRQLENLLDGLVIWCYIT